MNVAGKPKPRCDCDWEAISRPLRCNEEDDDE